MKTWIIYKHTNKINGKSYIGQTSQKVNRRWQYGNGYKQDKLFYRAIRKYGWKNFEHTILNDNINSKKEANDLEQYWIDYYHTWIGDPNCMGYNLTPGGDTREIISESTKQKLRDANLGKKHTLITKQKMSASRGKKIICIETQEVFKSIRAAEIKYNNRAIHKCISGACQTACGYHWAYLTDNEKILKLSKYAGTNIKTNNHPVSKVICVELDQKFNSIKEASQALNIDASHISRVCLGHRKTAGGYHWKYVN